MSLLQNSFSKNSFAQFFRLKRRAPNYCNLPVELKWEIIKQADFLTRARLRQCSKQELCLVDSHKYKIPIVKFQFAGRNNDDDDILAVTICEGVDKLSTVYIYRNLYASSDRFIIKWNFEMMDIYKHCQPMKSWSKFSFKVVSRQLSRALNQKNVIIGKIMIEFSMDSEFFSRGFENLFKRRFFPDNCPPIIAMCNSTWMTRHIQWADDYVIVDIPTLWDAKNRLVFRSLVQNEKFFECFNCESGLGNFVCKLYSNLNDEPKKYCYWIPGMKATEKDYELIFEKCNANIISSSENNTTLWLPSREIGLMIRVTECGTVIETIPVNSEITQKKNCGLHWMCPNCDQSPESWLKRENLKIMLRNKSKNYPALRWSPYHRLLLPICFFGSTVVEWTQVIF